MIHVDDLLVAAAAVSFWGSCASSMTSLFFLWPAPLSFDWSPHLRLTCGPAGSRTTTGSLSASSRIYDISMQCIEKLGDELTFLKRLHVLYPDGRLTLQTHHKHVMQLCSMNPKVQNKKSPGHSDIDREDTMAALTAETSTVFRTCVGILMHLANDLPHCQYVIRHLSTYSSKPAEKSMVMLRHLVAYFACHGDIS